MYKILVVAVREYRAMVATRAFLISLVMMPVLMLGSLAAIEMLKNSGRIEERHILVLDPAGNWFDDLAAAAEQQNRFVQQSADAAGVPGGRGEGIAAQDDGLPQVARGELYLLRRWEPKPGEKLDDDLRVELSRQVRAGELYGFVEFPPAEAGADGIPAEVRFYSQDSSLASARGWLAAVSSAIARDRRLRQANVLPETVAAASAPVPVRGLGLIERDATGAIVPPRERNELADIFLPFGAMMFMFLVIFMASQPMLESVLEEKSQRIAEVLLGSVSPFQLMLGKLLGSVAGSLTVFCIYVAGGMVVARRVEWITELPLSLLPWFVICQILGVLIYAAIFMAVGACVSQLKEAQSMLMPVWLMLMAPVFVWLLILRAPNGGLARGLSLFPPTASTSMVMRLATGAAIPWWELAASIAGLVLATLLIVLFAGRVFRAGILWQGKTPRLGEIIRWAISG